MAAQVTDSGITVTTGVAADAYTSWTRGTLVFDWVALRDMMTEFVRVYNVDIRIVDSTLAMRKMRMEVSVDEQTLPQILDLICEVFDAHYTRDGRRFIIAPGRAVSRAPHLESPRHRFPQLEKIYGK
jgi:ferric-dicitrate binding protein FerR (iron transport regulator)